MTLDEFNALSEEDAEAALLMCCVSQRWVQEMLAARPYLSASALLMHATAVWNGLQEEDFLQAFEGHPKIGDIQSLREKYAATGSLAASEQAGVHGADENLIKRLAVGNANYERRFGYIFIVCASGKSAGEMCELLESRLSNLPEQEIAIAAEEQRKILTMRLENML